MIFIYCVGISPAQLTVYERGVRGGPEMNQFRKYSFKLLFLLTFLINCNCFKLFLIFLLRHLLRVSLKQLWERCIWTVRISISTNLSMTMFYYFDFDECKYWNFVLKNCVVVKDLWLEGWLLSLLISCELKFDGDEENKKIDSRDFWEIETL